MNRKWLYAWSFAILPILFLMLDAQASTLFTIPVLEDAWVSESSPASNYGNASYLTVKDTSKRAEGFLRFSDAALSELKEMKVISASLFLYQYQGTYNPGDEILLHQVTCDWQEASAAWNSRPVYLDESVDSLAFTSGNNTWRRWDGLEGTVSSWMSGPNYGVALENNRDGKLEELYARFYSSESANLDMRPYFEVVAEPIRTASAVPEPLTSVMLLFGIGALGVRKLR